ncbi:MAG: hypothetical protein ABIZ81_10455, partial [Opitutaceae bacterium]
MKLIWHIITKDARRLWPLVLLWSVLFSLHRFAEWQVDHATTAENAEALARLKFIEILTFVVQLLTAYIFAATLVLEDSPIGTSTFWPTRPIAGVRLLVAKVLAAVLWFGVLAVLLSLPWWKVGDAFETDLVLRVTALLCGQTLLVLTSILVASFAGSLEKFLGWSIGLVLAQFALGLSAG